MITVRTYAGKTLGTIEFTPSGLTASTPGLQDIADSFARRHENDVLSAYNELDGWQNGYLWASSDPEAQMAEDA